MRITFSPNAWEDYISWQADDRKILKKINELIRDIMKTPYSGLGKPEALKFDLSGYWSRRIDMEHRLVYKIIDDEILIYACRYHYDP
ncbi:MAG TPA: Txe/YoeB family addiction module toxin [Saprospiraceae bacterium]|nr:Txe/YoeB family addiction module toxin [Saprospiraceae bacterium]